MDGDAQEETEEPTAQSMMMAFDDGGRASTSRGAWLLVHIPSDEARSRLIDHGVKLLCDVLERGYDEVRTAVNATFFKKRKEPLGKAVVSSGTLRVWSADGSEKLGTHSRYICVDYKRPTVSVHQQRRAARPPSPRHDAVGGDGKFQHRVSSCSSSSSSSNSGSRHELERPPPLEELYARGACAA